jgi:type IX secretion system PorP/SprF family membrane protein
MKNICKPGYACIFVKWLLSLSVLMTMTLAKVHAQLNPLTAQYFANPYLSNPAMAGSEKGLEINLHFSRQTGNAPGSPVYQSFTAAYGSGKNVGLGLNVVNDKSGLFNRTRVMGTYTYHLPLGNDQRLSFGLSLGVMNERLISEDIIGDIYDPAIRYFNDREFSIDGDFGIAYHGKQLSLQGAVPNLKSFLRNDGDFEAADRPLFYTAVSYKFNLENVPGLTAVEPKFCYRGIRSYDNIWDAGANITLADNWLNVMLMYHSTENVTFGLGVNYKSKAVVSLMFTTGTATQKVYSNAEFELGLKLTL